MKNESQAQGKNDIAQETFISTMFRLNFPIGVISQFITSIREEEKTVDNMLEKIEGGIDTLGLRSSRRGGWKATGKSLYGIEIWDYDKGDYSAFDQRNDVVSMQSSVNYIGTICLMGALRNDKFVNTTALNPSIVTDSQHEEAREAIQLCVLQFLAMNREISERELKQYRRVVKYLRNRFEVFRVQAHLNGCPTYTSNIIRIDLFIKILEQRVKLWDAPPPAKQAAVKKIRKSKKA